MKKIAFSLIVFSFAVIASAQETNGQFRERVYQVDDRFEQHVRMISRNGYSKSVDFETYLDDAAKAAAYAEFLSKAYDKVAQIFASFLSREQLRNHRKRADTLYEFAQNSDRLADESTGKATLANDAEWAEVAEKWAEAGYDFTSTWKEVYYRRKEFYVYRLEILRASRL